MRVLGCFNASSCRDPGHVGFAIWVLTGTGRMWLAARSLWVKRPIEVHNVMEPHKILWLCVSKLLFWSKEYRFGLQAGMPKIS